MLLRLFWAQLKVFVRDPQSIIFAFAFPVLMTVVFGTATNIESKPKEMALVTVSQDEVSRSLVSQLENTKLFELTRLKEEKAVRRGFDSEDFDIALIVPDLSNGGAVRMLYDEKSPEGLQTSAAIVSGMVNDLNLRLAGGEQKVVVVLKGLRDEKKFDRFDILIPLLIMFGSVYTNLTGAASSVASYRKNGTLKRLMVTPVKPKDLLQCDLAVRGLVSAFQAAAVVIVAKVAYGSTIGLSVSWVLLLAVVGSVTFTAIGTALGAATRNPNRAAGIATIVSTSMLFLDGGVLAEAMPERLIKASENLPLGLVVRSMRTVLLDGGTPFASPEAYTLIAWMIGSYLVARLLFKFREPERKRG